MTRLEGAGDEGGWRQEHYISPLPGAGLPDPGGDLGANVACLEDAFDQVFVEVGDLTVTSGVS